MPSKKKPRPLFEVPAEVGSRLESGWVYRSGVTHDEPAVVTDETPREETVAPVEQVKPVAQIAQVKTVAQVKPVAQAKPAEKTAEESVKAEVKPVGFVEASAHTLGLAMATVTQTFLIVATLVALPLTISIYAIDACARTDESR